MIGDIGDFVCVCCPRLPQQGSSIDISYHERGYKHGVTGNTIKVLRQKFQAYRLHSIAINGATIDRATNTWRHWQYNKSAILLPRHRKDPEMFLPRHFSLSNGGKKVLC